jgi:protein XRP2
MKTKLDRRNYMFDTRKGEVLIKTPGQIDGKDFVVMKCEDCTIFVCDHTSQVFVDDSINCKIYFGPCSGSLFIRDCKGKQTVTSKVSRYPALPASFGSPIHQT